MSSPGSIFISYRRSDSIAETGRIYDRLVSKFGKGHVFKDVDSIPFGVDFAEYLDQAVSQCQVVLVIIGKTWATVTEPDGTRRLENPDDFVRIEVESALKRAIPVIPVLLEGVSMPKRSQLPDSLHTLARRNGTQVGYDPRFHADMNRLEKGIESLLGQKGAPSPIINRTPRSAESYAIDLGNGVTLDLVHIPGGTFQMGAPASEEDSRDNERPQHKVAVPEFWMGKYPVTQAEYKAVIGNNPSHFKGDDLPVEQVSWHDAVKFCEKVSQKIGETICLPSESEWEYACRAGTTTRYYFGDTLTKELANFNTNVDETTPAGKYPANAFGLYDMHGNVSEWCQDKWQNNYDNAPDDGSAWEMGGYNSRVKRGGSWVFDPRNCRSAYRYYSYPDFRDGSIGFRVVCSAPRALQ